MAALPKLLVLWAFAVLFRLAFDSPLFAAWGSLSALLLAAVIAPAWVVIALKTSPRLGLAASAMTVLFMGASFTIDSMPDRSRFGTTSHVATLLFALFAIAWIGNGRWRDFGLGFDWSDRRLRKSLGWVVGVLVGLFLVLLVLVLTRVIPPGALGPTRTSLRETLIFQFVLVAIGEELVYRGFLQTSIDEVVPGRRRILGADLGWGALVSALLFGLVHVVHLSLDPLDVTFSFNPVLVTAFVYVYLRGYTGSLWPAVALHGLWNGLNNSLTHISASLG